MKKLSVLLLTFLCANLFLTSVFADTNTKISYSVPADIYFVDDGIKSHDEVYLNDKLTIPEISAPKDKIFAGFYYTINQIERKWNFDNDVVTYGILTDGISLTLYSKYVDKPIEKVVEEDKTKIIIVTKDYVNYLEAELDLPYGAIPISENEKGKDIKVALVVNELYNTNSDEKNRLEKYCDENNQDVLTYFEIIIEKTVDKNTSVINELNKKAKITITVPDYIYDENYDYSVYRAHTDLNGDVVVDNIYTGKANQDHKITLESDKFSAYALTIKKVDQEIIDNNNETIVDKNYDVNVPLFIAIVIAIVLLIAIFVISKIIRKKNYEK